MNYNDPRPTCESKSITTPGWCRSLLTRIGSWILQDRPPLCGGIHGCRTIAHKLTSASLSRAFKRRKMSVHAASGENILSRHDL
jgi:hypothetical protein